MNEQTQFSLPYSIRQLALAYHLEIHPSDIDESYQENSFSVNSRMTYQGQDPDEIAERVGKLREVLEKIGMNFPNRKQLIAWGDMLADYFSPPKEPRKQTTIYGAVFVSPKNKNFILEQRMKSMSFSRFCGLPTKEVFEPTTPKDFLIANNKFLRNHDSNNEEVKSMSLNAYNCIKAMIAELSPENNTSETLNTLYWLLYSSGDNEDRNNRSNYHVFAVRDAFEGKEIEDTRREYETNDGEYLVVTNDEANDLWDEDLENYIEECILHELPEQYREFFDSEKWKDYAKSDGREISLAGYDHDENTVQITLDEFIEYIKPLLIEQGYDVEEVENMTDLWVDFDDDSGLTELLAKGNISGIRPLYIYRTN